MALAGSFTGLPFPIPTLPQIPGLPSLGLMPSMTAQGGRRPSARLGLGDDRRRSTRWPRAWPSTSPARCSKPRAWRSATRRSRPARRSSIAGVAEEFTGEWIVTAARHLFESEDGGYSTWFEVSGRQDRTLLGLASLGTASVRPTTINGNVIGVVTNNNDPDTMGRVKLGFPWLAPFYESDWARVVQVGMGKEWGNLFLPEVGDEVLVGFEFGDSRRPYVIGGLINGKTEHPLLATRSSLPACRRRSSSAASCRASATS